MTEINELLDCVKETEAKEEISSFFLTDLPDYNDRIAKLAPCLREKEYSPDLEKALERLNIQILLKGYCLEELVADEKIVQKVKDNFRNVVGEWAYKSDIIKRAHEKPRGLAGDYRTLEFIYENKPVSRDIGLYFDNYFLKAPYCVALRNCKDHMRNMLKGFIQKSALDRMNILDIACGPCRELRELLPALLTKKIIKFNCLDCDDEALQFSNNALSGNASKNIEFSFTKIDLLNVIKNDSLEDLDKQDLIYSIGTIDYLDDETLKAFVRAIYRLLPAGGKLVFTHKNREKTYPALFPDWFCDWKFVGRNKEEIMHLFYTCGIYGFLLDWETDEFGYIYYFTMTKK